MNNYRIIKLLGKGGFGEAYQAQRIYDGLLVCIKRVAAGYRQAAHQEVLKEVRVLRALTRDCTKYVIEYLESFEEGGYLHIVTELAVNGDLGARIQKFRRCCTRPPEWQILGYFIQVALGIKEIHSRNIMHRDLKPQNIFLMLDGTVKLGDFGLAKVLNYTSQVARTQCGTIVYMSPEVALGRPYTNKTDIWALGCILYELCTLDHPFKSVEAILWGRYAPIPSCYSQELRILVDWMLQKDQNRRPTIREVLLMPFIRRWIHGGHFSPELFRERAKEEAAWFCQDLQMDLQRQACNVA